MSWYKNHSMEDGFVDNNLIKMLEDFDLGKLTENDMLEYFSKYKGVTQKPEEIRKEIDSYLSLDSKLVSIVMNLKEKGYKVALLTNANSSFFERHLYVKYPEFKNLFNETLISSEIKMIKPSREIFEYTIKKLNALAEECLLIDDSPANITGAQAVGINGFLYTFKNTESFTEYLKEIKVI